MIMTQTTTNRAGIVKLWLLNFVANAALLAAAYFWLLIPDARGWQVAGSALLAVLVIVLRALAARRDSGIFPRVRVSQARNSVWRAYRHALRHVPALAIWALVFGLITWLFWGLHGYVPQFAVWLRQKLNAGPPPRNIMADVNWLLFLLNCVVLPALWLPIATTVSAVGFQARTHCALTSRMEAASLLAVVLPAAGCSGSIFHTSWSGGFPICRPSASRHGAWDCASSLPT